ncbi:MAG: hypothetical protein KAV42_03265 [Candidatus Krumholzibacteria bacterium]|nr:hypothetical protein [Candidatus Krumholzibacteria bacterium]
MKCLHVRAWLLVVCLAMLIPASGVAQPLSYIGLYADPYHYDGDVVIWEPYAGWTTWVWVMPGNDGMMCAEFMIQNPPYVLNIGTTPNPAHSVTLGDPFTGISICFPECQYDWTWLYQLSALPVEVGPYDYVYVLPHPDTDAVQIATCEAGYPIQPVTYCLHLGINQYSGG